MFGFRKAKKPEGFEFIVCGLGNPGLRYAKTRHNVGFMAIDFIAEKLGVKVNRLKFKSLCGEAEIGGKKVLFMKPSTFMNKSGEAVREAAQFYKIPPERAIIIFDDISLPPGKIRIRRKGSDGGHNGMKNIIYLSGSDDFPRIKVGIGAKPHPDYELADWVLSEFSREDFQAVFSRMEDIFNALCLIVEGKTDEAMNLYN